MLNERFSKEIIVHREVTLPKKDTNTTRSRIDFLIEFKDYNIIIPIEVKHHERRWTKKEMRKQINLYKRKLRSRVGYHGVYLMSPTGKYGHSEEDILHIIDNVIINSEIILPDNRI